MSMFISYNEGNQIFIIILQIIIILKKAHNYQIMKVLSKQSLHNFEERAKKFTESH